MKKSRKKYLNERNFKKYLAYASGEIIIVVVGILIALYLNNWNQKRINKKQEIQYYQSIKNQLNEDMNTLIGEIDYNQSYLDQFTFAKTLIMRNDKSKIDTLGRIILHMVRYSDFRQKSNVYQTLVNSGQIIIITNHQVTERLQSLEENYNYINRLEENHATIIISQIIPSIKQIIQFDPIKIKDPRTLFSYKFQNNFDVLIGLMNEKKQAYGQAITEIKSILKSIEQELN